MNAKLQKWIGGYIKLRDKKSEMEERHREEMAPINELMAKIEAQMLEHMSEEGATSIKTEAGTAYRTTRTSTSVADRSAFMGFVIENEAWEFLESRANKSAVVAYKEEHDDLPPGLNWREQVVVNFRRS